MTATTRRGLLGTIGIGAAIAALATLVAWGLGRTAYVERAELATYDLRVQATAQPSAPSPDIVLVSIDDDSVRRMAPLVGRWPWPRLAHATLIDFLARAPAKLVVYDVLFTEPDAGRFSVGNEDWTGADSDEALAEAIRRSGNIVLAADAAAEELVDTGKTLQAPLDGISSLNQPYNAGDCVEPRPVLVPPIEILANAARFIGHSLMVLDADGPARRMIPFVRVGERHIPSLSVVAALGVQNLAASAVRPSPGHLTIGGPPIPLVEQTVPDFYGAASRACRVLIAFRGPSFSERGIATFNGYSFYDLFRSEIQIQQGEKPDVDPASFKDRIVVVGASASGTYDVFSTPFGLPASGAEIHANAIDALLHARTLRPLPMVPGGIAATLAGALVVGVAGAVVSPWVLAAIAVVLSGVVVWASVQWFAGGLWTPLVQPLMAIGLAFVGQLAWQYFVEGREKRQVKRLFSRYVPKDVYEQLHRRPGARGAGRPASHHDRPLLRCARFHGDVGEGDAGGSRRPAERVLLAHGAGAVRAPRHAR